MTVCTLVVCFTPLGKSLPHYFIDLLNGTHWIVYVVAVLIGAIFFIGSKFLFDLMIKKYEECKKN